MIEGTPDVDTGVGGRGVDDLDSVDGPSEGEARPPIDWLENLALEEGCDVSAMARALLIMQCRPSASEVLALSKDSRDAWLVQAKILSDERELDQAAMLIDPEAHAITIGARLYGPEFALEYLSRKREIEFASQMADRQTN